MAKKDRPINRFGDYKQKVLPGRWDERSHMTVRQDEDSRTPPTDDPDQVGLDDLESAMGIVILRGPEGVAR